MADVPAVPPHPGLAPTGRAHSQYHPLRGCQRSLHGQLGGYLLPPQGSVAAGDDSDGEGLESDQDFAAGTGLWC